MAMDEPAGPGRRWRQFAGVAALLVLAVAAWFLRGADWRGGVETGIAWLRAAGPGWFFLAMAVVPLPLATFTIPAGEAFAAQLTLGGVIAAAAGAVAVQVSLSYWLARYALRPLVERLVRRRGLAVPVVTPQNALTIALLVRLTPGPPMFLGSCVLALAATPFRLYWIVSWLVALPWVCAGVILGRGLLSGNFTLVASGVGLLVAAALAARWWRRRGRRDPG